MLDSERPESSSENGKKVAEEEATKDSSSSKKPKQEGGEGEGTPSLSQDDKSGDGGAKGKEDAKEDDVVDTTKTNGVAVKAEAMDVEEDAADEIKKEIKKEDDKKEDEEDVEMKDAAAETPEKSNKNIKKENSNSTSDTPPQSSNKDKDNDDDKAEKPPPKDKPKQQSTEEEKKVDGDKSKDASAAPAASAGDTKTGSAPNPPPPVLKGTLSYNLDLRRHVIRGMWNYENSNAFPPQRFELLRTLDKEEDPKELPKDGEFHGSFSLAYFHTTSKGKQKERSKVITEHGVKIVFTKIEGEEEYKVDGKGTNQFGIFHINGNATPSQHEGDPVYDIVLRKRYEPSPQPPSRGEDGGSKKRKSMGEDGGAAGKLDGPLPPPSKSYPNGVVCLRGNLFKDQSQELGATDVVHRITGMWSSGLDLILADPQNAIGNCNKFEYEHKSAVPTNQFPVSGRYSGWFHLTTPEGKRTTISERDVNLRFTKNNAGYHNVEGRGSNAFGKYTITGTLSAENVITIFRHFKPLKTKAPKAQSSVTSAPPPINKGGAASSRRPQHTFPEPRMAMSEVIVPGDENGAPLEPIKPPDNTTYSAVSQGVLRLNEDGSHQCTGKWAVTREHFTSGQTSQFNFRLESHYALEAVNEKKRKEGIKVEETTAAGTPVIPQDFPLDSALYKGSFQLKKKGNRYDTIVDQQIVMKFRKSTSGAYNVYGRGVNNIGVFNLIGTMIMRGKASGQVELYRTYPPELLVKQKITPASLPGKAPVFPKPAAAAPGDVAPLPAMPKTQLLSGASTIMPSRAGLVRRESTRVVKMPSRLEDDDPKAQLVRIMEKCVVILRYIREKDIERGAFFSEPVDPVALGIPTYRQFITEPMDLGTVARRLEGNQIDTPEEFGRLVRLTFENAITFNVDPNHSVHLAARYLLVEFNKKWRDIERLLETLRRAHKDNTALLVDDKDKKKPVDKKRKRKDEPKSLKRRRIEEAQTMSADNVKAMAAVVAAAPQGVPNASVSRGEFNMMIHMIQLLQKQTVQTHNALAELSPGDDTDEVAAPAAPVAAGVPAFDPVASFARAGPAPAPERKKPKKKAEAPKKAPAPAPLPPVVEEPAIAFDETKPLTLQEQETLTETINNMPPEHIPGVIQIIRESASLNGDEDEIDLEIDQLDAVTQRKLLRHVSKFIKPKRTKSKVPRKKAAAPAPAPAPAPKPIPKKAEKPPAKKPTSPKKSDPGSFFAAFGGEDDSDSDSDDDDDEPPKQTASSTPSGGKHFAAAASSSKSDGFDLGDSFSGLNKDDDDDDDEDLGNGGLTANWNISKSVSKDAEKDKGGDDDDWGAARNEAEATAKRNADREAREKKQREDKEKERKEQLEVLKLKKEKEEEEEARKKAEKEKKEKDAIEAERAKMRAEAGAVEQTVDMDAQRDIMKQYEQSFLDKELGSASPSSDFGF